MFTVKPMFSKKHYEALADALRRSRVRVEAVDPLVGAVITSGINLVEAEIVASLVDDSATFDSDRFAHMSGMERTS